MNRPPEQTPQTPLLRTAQAAQAAGVSRQTLHYYLLLGLVLPTQRTATGQQLFDSIAVRRIRLVKQINESGYPLREIRDIFLKPHHLRPTAPPRPSRERRQGKQWSSRETGSSSA